MALHLHQPVPGLWHLRVHQCGMVLGLHFGCRGTLPSEELHSSWQHVEKRKTQQFLMLSTG